MMLLAISERTESLVRFKQPGARSGDAAHRLGALIPPARCCGVEPVVAPVRPSPATDVFWSGDNNRNKKQGFVATSLHQTRLHGRGTRAESNRLPVPHRRVARVNAALTVAPGCPCLALVLGTLARRSRRDRAAGSAETVRTETRVPQLLAGPLGGGVCSRVEVNDATAVMGQHQEDIQNPESNRGHGEEINGGELRDVVPEEGMPRLRTWFSAVHHVLNDTGLADVDTQFKQFAMDTRSAPGGIFPAHLADQISNFASDDGTPGLSVPNFPSPEEAKAFAMPSNYSFGLHDDQSRAPAPPNA